MEEKERDMPSTWSIPINIIIFGIAEDDGGRGVANAIGRDAKILGRSN